MKRRDCHLCNAKALLIFCVVLGHALERDLIWSAPAAALYRIVYLFHMPLFAFLSGMGVKTPSACLRQAGRMLRLYLLAQGFCVLAALAWWPEQSGTLLSTPVWILWYPLSLASWCVLSAGLGHLAERRGRPGRARIALFLFALAAGLAVGNCDAVGRPWSLSRTLVFFPGFLAGRFWGWRWMARLTRLRGRKLPVCAAALTTSWLCWRALAGVEVRFLYQADSYAALSLSLVEGIRLRLLCYLGASAFSVLFLALCPSKHVFFTPLGNDTLPVFLCHPAFTALLRYLPYPVTLAVPAAALCAATAVGVIYLVGRWSRPLVRYQES